MRFPSAFSIDERYDRVHASDRRSRYGAYLARYPTAFGTDGRPTRDPAEFAAAALEVALPPVMSPPYVASHRRILGAWIHHDNEGRVAIGVSIASPLPTNVATVLSWNWRGWTTHGRGDRYAEPYDNDRPVALAKLNLRIPLDRRKLPEPGYHANGTPKVEAAKEAVHLAVVQLNGALGELLATLAIRSVA